MMRQKNSPGHGGSLPASLNQSSLDTQGSRTSQEQLGSERVNEVQEKFVNARVTEVEKNFGQLCTEFGAYARRTAKLRDNGDQICRLLLQHSEHQSNNKTTQVALKKFVEHLSAAEDYRDSEVSRLTEKVLGPLSQYGQECKHVKTNLKSAFTARKKEEDQVKKLDRLKDKSASDPVKLTKARSDLERASLDASKGSRDLEREILTFESKKLKGLKLILRDFIQIELLWHAKALEMYSKAFNDLELMDEEEDLEEFRSSLRPEAAASRLQRHRHGGSQGSLHSTGSLGRGTMGSMGTTGGLSRPPSLPRPNANARSAANNGHGGQSRDPPRVRIQRPSVTNVWENNHLESGSEDDYDEDDEEDDEEDDDYDDEDEVSEEEEEDSDFETTTATTPGRPAAAVINGRQARR